MNPSRHFSTYGLGWNLTDNRGRLVLSHMGGIDGMQALALLLPEESVGLVVLTNRIPHSSTAAISQTLIDRLTGAPEKDWSAVLQEMDHVDLAAAEAARQKQKETRAAGTHPALPLNAYTGVYHNPAIGDLAVIEENGSLALLPVDYPGLRGVLEHWHYDTFLCRWSDPTYGECLVPFQIDPAGMVESLKVQVDPFIDPVVYLFTCKK